jgi:hypothetical protein
MLFVDVTGEAWLTDEGRGTRGGRERGLTSWEGRGDVRVGRAAGAGRSTGDSSRAEQESRKEGDAEHGVDWGAYNGGRRKTVMEGG